MFQTVSRLSFNSAAGQHSTAQHGGGLNSTFCLMIDLGYLLLAAPCPASASTSVAGARRREQRGQPPPWDCKRGGAPAVGAIWTRRVQHVFAADATALPLHCDATLQEVAGRWRRVRVRPPVPCLLTAACHVGVGGTEMARCQASTSKARLHEHNGGAGPDGRDGKQHAPRNNNGSWHRGATQKPPTATAL